MILIRGQNAENHGFTKYLFRLCTICGKTSIVTYTSQSSHLDVSLKLVRRDSAGIDGLVSMMFQGLPFLSRVMCRFDEFTTSWLEERMRHVVRYSCFREERVTIHPW